MTVAADDEVVGDSSQPRGRRVWQATFPPRKEEPNECLLADVVCLVGITDHRPDVALETGDVGCETRRDGVVGGLRVSLEDGFCVHRSTLCRPLHGGLASVW